VRIKLNGTIPTANISAPNAIARGMPRHNKSSITINHSQQLLRCLSKTVTVRPIAGPKSASKVNRGNIKNKKRNRSSLFDGNIISIGQPSKFHGSK